MKWFNNALWGVLLLVATLPAGCKKDDGGKENAAIRDPAEITVVVEQAAGTAVISGKADPGVELSLKYIAARGQLLQKGQSDGTGRFTFTIDLLPAYAQQLQVLAARTQPVAETSNTVAIEVIPAKDPVAGLTVAAIKEKLTGARWRSDQSGSRVIIGQTAASPPYEMFITQAQKYFDFKTDGALQFQVTSPVTFTDAKGSWEVSDDGVITINTNIPLGPMQLKNGRIRKIADNSLSLLVEISDGVFLLNLVKDN
ncbi:MAG: hypothetical protein P0Y53_12650 [Candidatus Pseudobacter hemicellulosilyticus]|uniref:Uncharacterized protein n=1 Tax=Candidatus Pseudobacter hemicellulosilyticus TaxID=3121375 RepID=A0AAJ5WVS6_9BACT|nr:MAG: hypothetical protein P0Y53_12650 [Pseudobacter sp.]